MRAFPAGIRCSNGPAFLLPKWLPASSSKQDPRLHQMDLAGRLWHNHLTPNPEVVFLFFFSVHPTSPTAAVNHAHDVMCLRLTHHQHLCDGCNIGPLRFPAKKFARFQPRWHTLIAILHRPHVYIQNSIQHKLCKIQWIDIYKHMDIDYWIWSTYIDHVFWRPDQKRFGNHLSANFSFGKYNLEKMKLAMKL